jgi:hypothetical protein
MALNGRNQLSAMARRPATSGGVSLDRRTNVFTIPERVVSMPGGGHQFFYSLVGGSTEGRV